MEMIFCPNCNKLTGYKRVLGFGTFFAVLLTGGSWLLTIPFYPKRCINCGLRKSHSVPWYQTWRLAFVLILGLLAFASLMTALLRPSHPRPANFNQPNYDKPADLLRPARLQETPQTKSLQYAIVL